MFRVLFTSLMYITCLCMYIIHDRARSISHNYVIYHFLWTFGSSILICSLVLIISLAKIVYYYFAVFGKVLSQIFVGSMVYSERKYFWVTKIVKLYVQFTVIFVSSSFSLIIKKKNCFGLIQYNVLLEISNLRLHLQSAFALIRLVK